MTGAALWQKPEKSRKNEASTSITERHYVFMTKVCMNLRDNWNQVSSWLNILNGILQTVEGDNWHFESFHTSLVSLQTEEALTDFYLPSLHACLIIILAICVTSSFGNIWWCTYVNEQNVIRANSNAISDMFIPMYVMRLNTSSWLP